MKFNFYSDPGHGWLKVKKSLLAKLGIAEKISPYSYMRGEFAYLEEDCDFSVFYHAMESIQKPVEYKQHRSEKSSKIRSYNTYRVV